MRGHRTIIGAAVLAMAVLAGCGSQENGEEVIPPLTEGRDDEESPPSDLPEVPENAARVFENTRGDLGDYAVRPLRIEEGEATVELWAEEDLGPQEEPEVHDFVGAEGDTFDLDGATVAFIEVEEDHDPRYVTVALE